MADNLLLKLLPPETDHLNYLILLEHNLTIDQLPILHDILQDTNLTANIGWDLVHLLLPFLPASQRCLQDVARLGNPREVVLKVTELLEQIGSEEVGNGDDEGDEKEEDVGLEKLKISGEGGDKIADESPASKAPTKSTQFIALLEMLSILHPRIRTKYPSRFLSTSLQAILPAYTQVSNSQDATEAVLGFIKALSNVRRPRLPPRKSSNAVLLQEKERPESAPDPEGKDESLAPDEGALQNRLLQSFLTHVTDDYILTVSTGEICGMAWSSRLHEKLHPEKRIPGKISYSVLFAEEDYLHSRDAIMGQIVALARDIKLSSDHLVSVISNPEPLVSEDTSSDLPSTASDVPLSHAGSLHLFSAMAAASALFDAPTSLPDMGIHPNYTAILDTFIAEPESSGIGSEPVPLIDSIIFLGTFILNKQTLSLPLDDAQFNNILQRLSLLSAHTSSPELRYHAHLLTSKILHSHPSDHVRLAFVKDTLEHCPYESLKASTVGWLKTEILAADDHSAESIFKTPEALTTVAPLIFSHAQLSSLMDQTDLPVSEKISNFGANTPFYLATLNLYYLLLSSSMLFERLEIRRLTEEYGRQFVREIGRVCEVVRVEGGDEEDVVLVEGVIERVRGAMETAMKE